MAEGLRILAAEDVETNRLVLTAFVAALGGKLTLAADGYEAIAAWEDAEFDLILMDIRMPNMDGIEAVREIRRAESARGRKRTPIIALTANAMQEAAEDCQAAGMDGFLAKPIDIRALVQLLRTHVPPPVALEASAG
jgi:CheY-like chemotaxis protein